MTHAAIFTALVSLAFVQSEKESAQKSYWKKHAVESVNPQSRSIGVHESGVEITWDKTTRFFRHRTVRLKELKLNSVIHVFGKLHSPRQAVSASGELMITDISYLGTGDGFESPQLVPANSMIGWHTGTLRSARSPYYIRVGGSEYRLVVEEGATVCATEKITPQALSGKQAFIRGRAEKGSAETGGKPRQVTRILAREAHLIELSPQHSKIFQTQWSEERKTGTGLLGEYFGTSNFKELKVTRMDASVDFDWGTSAPDPSMPEENFSVRWTGQVKALATESVTFYTFTDDGVRLWVNGELLVDKWVGQGPTEWSGSIDLTAGQKYDIRMEYFDGLKNAVARLLWSSSSIDRQVIPQSQLYPPPAEPPGPPSPTKLTAAPAGNGAVTLTWTQSTASGIKENKVYRATKSGGPYKLIATVAATTTYEDKSATGSDHYVVTAATRAGESAYSNQASAKPASK